MESSQGSREPEKIELPVAQEGNSYSLTSLPASERNIPGFCNDFPNGAGMSLGEHLSFRNPFLSQFVFESLLGSLFNHLPNREGNRDSRVCSVLSFQVQSSSGGTLPYDQPPPWNGGAGGRVGIFPGVRDRASSKDARTICVPAVGSRLL